MPITDKQCEQLFYRALAAEIGIAIEVPADGIHALKVQLYTVRKELNDPALMELMIFEPNPIDGKHELFIAKKATPLPDA